jgi:hypothetical protein
MRTNYSWRRNSIRSVFVFKCQGLIAALLLSTGTLLAQSDIYVSVKGNDHAPGTLQRPVQTLHKAVAMAALQKGQNVAILLRGGVYYLNSTVTINAADTRFKSLKIQPYKEEKVTISGAAPVQPDWQEYKPGIYKAHLPLAFVPDRFYVNGHAMPMARYPNYDSTARIFNGTAADAISTERVQRWQHPEGAYIHALHSGEWGGFHYRVTGKKSNGELTMEGGWQNNRPSAMHNKHRFAENVFEELDAPWEWFYNKQEQNLYLYAPVGTSLPQAKLTVGKLDELIVLKGTRLQPLKYISIVGIHFTETNRTFMRTEEPLLRSDWTIFRGGAISCAYTEYVSIANCTLDELGGNAIFFSNYNRHGFVKDNHIFHAGASAIAFVGSPEAVRSPAFRYEQFVPWEQMDYTPGPKSDDYPDGCSANGNLIHDIGQVEKQSAGVQIEMAASINVVHNTIYNVPRAGINVGDGCWGGHFIAFNDVFNTVLETGDHGAFNSWGRDRFWSPDRNMIDSIVAARPNIRFLDAMKPTKLYNNRFYCAHGWDIDLDDGSGNYIIENNVCLNGGLKLREGYGRIVRNNIMINNSFHPHVWLANSGDVFTRNVVTLPYAPIAMDHWGNRIDSNFFMTDQALQAARQLKQDAHSISGNPQFMDASTGDYRFKSTSPVLKYGIRNIVNDFGVTNPRLKQLAQPAPVPTLLVKEQSGAGEKKDWLGATIKNIESLGERSAAGLPDQNGVLVVAMAPGSILAGSGLKKGDVIIRLGGDATNNMTDLLQVYQQKRWMGQAEAVIVRNQAAQKIQLMLKTAD